MDTNMALDDLAIKRAKPDPKIIKLSDGHGLQLCVTPDGAKRWRIAHRFGGAQKTLAIGVYPAIGLKEARQAREDAQRSLSKGQDLSQAKREAKAAPRRPFPNKATCWPSPKWNRRRAEGARIRVRGTCSDERAPHAED